VPVNHIVLATPVFFVFVLIALELAITRAEAGRLAVGALAAVLILA
jgi:hypothetical protein